VSGGASAATHPRPFRFGVQAMAAETAAAWRGVARQVEDLGFSTLFVADHYLGPGPLYDRSNHLPQNLAPIAAMAMAAEATTRLRIGCRVFCVDYHVPAVLAAETATLDLLSDGRVEVGLGAGYLADEYDAMGIPLEPGGRRVDKLEEVVNLLKAHWSGEPIEARGDHVKVSGYTGVPRPVQRPHPPILIGGDRNRILGLAGRHADIASLNYVPLVVVNEAGLTPEQEAVRRMGIVRDAAGSRFDDIELETSPYWVDVTGDTRAALERVMAMMHVEEEGLLDHPNVLIGSVDTVVERLERRREVMGVSYVTVPHAQMHAFVPVVARLTGT
jgi:probable F420-dependent oxidoreductase